MSKTDCPEIRKPAQRELQHTAVRDNSATHCILSVDVEDWFHILDVSSSPALSLWHTLPSRVEGNFWRLLEICASKNARATCFFLGWVGEKYPHLVREAVARGHEIASHGYSHRLLYHMTPSEFRQDSLRSRLLLEDIGGTEVMGYRVPGFSVTGATPWFFDELLAAGYKYDSSIFPASRAHGGMPGGIRVPHVVGNGNGHIIEFPITVAEFGGRRLCLFGGGYLRISPYWLISGMAHKLLKAGLPVVFYIHPREIDPEQPRLAMSLRRQFKSYVNLRGTEKKVSRVLDEFPVITFREFLASNGQRWNLREVA